VSESALRFPAWIGIVCDDLEKQRRFYRDSLGLRELASGSDWLQFDFGPGATFELLARDRRRPQYDRRRYQVGFDVDDIATVRKHLLARGVQPITEIIRADEGGSRWAYFRDAEGNVFEITQR
jgi:catechol 2,3-dioxygenase-like lactoylglutathione lyase family enzyme